MADLNEKETPVRRGWNGSSGHGSIKVVRRNGGAVSKPAASTLVRGLIAGVIVVLAGVVAMFALSPTVEKLEEEPVVQKEQKEIEVVKPAEAPKVIEEDKFVTNRYGEVVKYVPPKTYTDERGILRYEGGARVLSKDAKERAVKVNQKSNIPHFNHPVEREIATLLTVQPGMPLFGSPKLPNLKQDFMNALMEKIEITDEDTPLDREIKEAVEATKRDLAERIKAGEDLATILMETRQEITRLAQYKREMQKILSDTVRNSELSDQDVEDTFAAANRMLEEKGIAPISANHVLRRRQQILINEERRRAAAEQEGN